MRPNPNWLTRFTVLSGSPKSNMKRFSRTHYIVVTPPATRSLVPLAQNRFKHKPAFAHPAVSRSDLWKQLLSRLGLIFLKKVMLLSSASPQLAGFLRL